MEEREIAKIPSVPDLSPRAITLLGKLCFRGTAKQISYADCIMIFGTAVSFHELAESFFQLIKTIKTKKIIITGGMEKYADAKKHDWVESETIFAAIKDAIADDVTVYLEKKSQNTYENVFFSLPFLDRSISSICFLTKSFHATRAYLTLKKLVPQVDIFPFTYDAIYPTVGKRFRQEDWFVYPEYLARVWGEFLRIKYYGKRGDLPLEEVEDILNAIDKEVGNEKVS